MLKRGFTLLELVVVIVVIGILATIAIPNYNKAKERALSKEAIASLKFIAGAEEMYEGEKDNYYFPVPSSNTADINRNLKLQLNTANWDYAITNADTFTITADRVSGPYSACVYTITKAGADAGNEPSAASCP